MATLNEMLLAGAQASVTNAPDGMEAVKTGAQLAQTRENIANQRAQIEQQKEQLQMQKVDKLTSAYENALKIKSPGARKAYLNNYLPRMEKALKLDGMISEDVKSMIQADPEQIKKIQALVKEVREGRKTREEAFATMQDPELFAAAEEYDDQFIKAEEAAEKFKEKKAIAEIMGQGQANRAAADDARAGQVKVDQKIAEDYADYDALGGSEALDKNIGLLESAITDLENGVKSGGLTGKIGLFSDKALDLTNPQLAATRDKVRGAIQMSLRQIMGPQFTENEAMAMFNRAFAPNQSPKENIRRVKTEVEAIKARAAKKKDTFKKFESEGMTLKPNNKTEFVTINGKNWRKSDLQERAKNPGWIEKAASQSGMSTNEFKKLIGM